MGHSLFSNSFYLYFSNFSDSVLLLFLLPFIARIFGPSMIGEIGLSQSIGLIFLIILEYGFTVSATKNIALNSCIKEDQILASQIFSFKLFLLPIVIFLTYSITLIHPIFIEKPYLIVISAFDAIFQSFIPSWYFKGKQRFKYLAITRIIFRSIAFFAIFLFVKSSADSWIYLILLAASSFFIAITQILIMKGEIGRIKLCRWQKIKPAVLSSTYNYFIILLPTLFNNIGILALSYLASPVYVGYYYGISKIHRAFNTLYTPIFESFFPYIVKSYNQDKKKAFNKMKLYNLVIFSIGVLFLLLIWFFSKNIVVFFLGNNFSDAENYLKAFGFLLPLSVISYVWGNQWMIILGREKKFYQISMASNSIGILLLIMLMPKFFIYAIPISISFSEILKIIMITRTLVYDK